jgi:hypothetical protein
MGPEPAAVSLFPLPFQPKKSCMEAIKTLLKKAVALKETPKAAYWERK